MFRYVTLRYVMFSLRYVILPADLRFDALVLGSLLKPLVLPVALLLLERVPAGPFEAPALRRLVGDEELTCSVTTDQGTGGSSRRKAGPLLARRSLPAQQCAKPWPSRTQKCRATAGLTVTTGPAVCRALGLQCPEVLA